MTVFCSEARVISNSSLIQIIINFNNQIVYHIIYRHTELIMVKSNCRSVEKYQIAYRYKVNTYFHIFNIILNPLNRSKGSPHQRKIH